MNSRNDNRRAYQNVRLPETPTSTHLRAAAADYAAIASTMMTAIVDRSEARADYPFVDTKLDLITGRDFAPDDPIRGRDAIYGWIQGRGLEALAGHARWWEKRGEEADLVARIRPLAAGVLAQLRHMRARNAGHLSFFMTTAGEPFRLDDESRPVSFSLAPDSAYGFSDLFCAKGMFAAADWLGDGEARAEALTYIHAVDDTIHARTFRSDQISLDPKNRAEPRAGYHTHGAAMIQLGAWAMLVSAAEEGAVNGGLRLIDYELTNHANLDHRWSHLQHGDFWEAVDDEGQPYVEPDGVILSDPGHSLEFVGLAMKFILAADPVATTAQHQRLAAAKAKMNPLLQRNFRNGYLPGPQGISKAFDLVTRRQLNTDMPWWNLPETIRAAAFCLHAAESEAERAQCLQILRDCHNAFREFIRPDLHLMAYQTRDECGLPVAAIPATADADPGYHTGLSLLDAIDQLDRL
ncbi:MAG TPA: hypothetical protein QGF95_16505 [Candidatus Latescibacteria bacterium]|nr:hypothetical protein [Gemmatimonadaceae bacterium]MDP6015863.1 hypothetical protein [Candidatus Latescibacterota bacterium]HJP32148.1 hypothetical protein [Candidatus Latescibacterota bacterium]